MARWVQTGVAAKSPLTLAFASLLCLTVAVVLMRPLAAQDQTQAAATEATDDQGSGNLDAEALRVLVAPVAFYPDELLAIVLPASTMGLQVVQAQQLLDKRKTNASAQPGKDWDPAIIALLNYPDVIARMNADLDWTSRLGDAVINQQSDVMDAIQQIRNEAVASGYLKSDEKQVITQTQETVVIKSADPEVIYVPTYDPTVIVEQTYVTAPPPVYSAPYPYYYSPAATFFTGAFFGAALAYGFDWDNDDIDIDRGDININDSFNRNTNINRGDLGKYNIKNRPTQHGDKMSWQSNKKRASTRPANAGNRPAGVAPANRPATRPATGAGNKPAGNQRPNAGQVKNRAGNQQATGKGNSLGTMAPSRQTLQQSNRGQQSLKNRAPATNRSPSRQGAFGGSGGAGGSVMKQQNRGNRSMGGRSGGGGARRR